MGKLFSEQMWIFQEAGTATSPWASAASLTEARHEASLPLVALSSAPLSQILSSAKSGLAMTLVLACICSLFRVTLMESLIGRISFSSLLPPVIDQVQTVWFVAYSDKLTIFDDCNVDRGGAGDQGRGHVGLSELILLLVSFMI